MLWRAVRRGPLDVNVNGVEEEREYNKRHRRRKSSKEELKNILFHFYFSLSFSPRCSALQMIRSSFYTSPFIFAFHFYFSAFASFLFFFVSLFCIQCDVKWEVWALCMHFVFTVCLFLSGLWRHNCRVCFVSDYIVLVGSSTPNQCSNSPLAYK